MKDIDRIIHEPVRLRILSILTGVDLADFKFFLSTLGLSRGNLSSHMDKLERAGYVEVQKGFNGKIPHTDYRITDAGDVAVRAEAELLAGVAGPILASGRGSA